MNTNILSPGDLCNGKQLMEAYWLQRTYLKNPKISCLQFDRIQVNAFSQLSLICFECVGIMVEVSIDGVYDGISCTWQNLSKNQRLVVNTGSGSITTLSVSLPPLSYQ